MSSLRITQNSMNRTQLMGLNNSLSRLQNTQEQMTSGKRLNRPSDDPVDTVSALRYRGDKAILEQHAASIEDGLNRLRAADDALTRTVPMIQRIRTLAIAAANGVNGPQQLAAMGQEAAQLRDGIIQQANTQYANQPIFAGTANVPNAFEAVGPLPPVGTFLGNTAPVWRRVSDASGTAGLMDVAVSGQAAFGTSLTVGGSIDALVTAINTGDYAGINAGISAMENLQDQVLDAASLVGARSNRLSALQELNGRSTDSTVIALSKIEDVDFIKGAMDISVQSNAYEAALAASAKILQPSLMDFIR